MTMRETATLNRLESGQVPYEQEKHLSTLCSLWSKTRVYLVKFSMLGLSV